MTEDEWSKKNYATVKEMIEEALCTDGSHHKQWFLVQIAERLGINKEDLRKDLNKYDYELDEGIAP